MLPHVCVTQNCGKMERNHLKLLHFKILQRSHSNFWLGMKLIDTMTLLKIKNIYSGFTHFGYIRTQVSDFHNNFVLNCHVMHICG